MEPFVYLGQYAQYHDDVAAERERLEAAAARLPYRTTEDAERAVAARFWRDKIAPRLNRQTTSRDRGSPAQARLLDGSSIARQPVNDLEPLTITARPPAGRTRNMNVDDPVNDVSEPAWDDVVVNVDANETPGFVDPPVFPRSPLEMDRGVVAGRVARIGTRRENESANAIQQNRDALLRSTVLDGIVAGAPMATSPLRQRGIRRRTFWDGMGEIVEPVFDDVGRAWLTPEIAFDSAAPGAPVAMLAGVATSVFDEGRELYRLAQGLLTFLYNNSDVAYETAREIVGLVQEQLAELWNSDYEMGRLFAEVLIGESREDLAEVLNPENNAYERQYYRGRLFAPVAIAIASVLLARQPGLSVVARAGSGLRRLADRIATPAFRRRVGEILRREREELGRLLSDERGNAGFENEQPSQREANNNRPQSSSTATISSAQSRAAEFYRNYPSNPRLRPPRLLQRLEANIDNNRPIPPEDMRALANLRRRIETILLPNASSSERTEILFVLKRLENIEDFEGLRAAALRGVSRFRTGQSLVGNDIGAVGEVIVRHILTRRGFRHVMPIENLSNNGIDLIAMTPRGNIMVFEIKSGVRRAGGPSADQRNAIEFVRGRLERIATGNDGRPATTATREMAQRYLNQIQHDDHFTGVFVQVHNAMSDPRILIRRWGEDGLTHQRRAQRTLDDLLGSRNPERR